MRILVKDVMAVVDRIAPPEFAEEWDNAGLLAGHPDAGVTGILTALDVTPAVVEEAVSRGASMIVAHHPILFRPLRTLREDRPEGALAAMLLRHGISLYVAHTALDAAPSGLNDALAAALGIHVDGGGAYHRIGAWEGGDCAALLTHVQKALSAPHARRFGPANAPAARVASACGAGMEFWPDAHRQGAQVFITGDVKHHDALDALAAGLVVIDAGHAATERLAAELLAEGLQKAFNAVEYTVRVEVSRLDAYTRCPGKDTSC